MAGWTTLAVLNCTLLLVYLANHPSFPGDFCAFYTGAHIYSQNPGHLYDLPIQRQTEQALIGRNDIPYNHPPYELLVWLPLSPLGFHAAFWIWRLVSCLLLMLASCLLAKVLAPRFGCGALFIIALAFFPVPYCLWMGQDSVLMLAIFCGCTWFLMNGRDFGAGLILGLGCFKLELVLPIAAVYFLWRRWRLLFGFLCSAVTVSGVSLAMVGYSGIFQLAHLLIQGQTAKGMAVHPVMMPNIRGLLALLPFLSPNMQSAVAVSVSAGLLMVVAVALRKDQPPERLFALLVCFSTLVSFHLNLHDLTLLVLPIAMVLRSRLWQGEKTSALFVPLFALFCTPLYIVLLGAFKVALLALFVGWLWYGMNRKLNYEPVPSLISHEFGNLEPGAAT
jgi:Glycosyltransferase family 87